jgi:hypothetical protein
MVATSLMDPHFPRHPKSQGHNSVPFSLPSPFRRESVSGGSEFSLSFHGFVFNYETLSRHYSLRSPTGTAASCTNPTGRLWVPSVTVCPWPGFRLTLGSGGAFTLTGSLEPWLTRVSLSRQSIQAESCVRHGPFSLQQIEWRPELFVSQLTTGPSTFGCVLSSRPGFRRTQQFFVHFAVHALAFSTHFVTWYEYEQLFAVVQAMSIRCPRSRMTVTSVMGDAPMRLGYTMTGWRELPWAGVKRLKMAVFGELEDKDSDLACRVGACVSVDWANGARFHFCVTNGKVGYAVRVPLGACSVKIVAEAKTTGSCVKLVIEDGKG